jgi:hypothetical protein
VPQTPLQVLDATPERPSRAQDVRTHADGPELSLTIQDLAPGLHILAVRLRPNPFPQVPADPQPWAVPAAAAAAARDTRAVFVADRRPVHPWALRRAAALDGPGLRRARAGWPARFTIRVRPLRSVGGGGGGGESGESPAGPAAPRATLGEEKAGRPAGGDFFSVFLRGPAIVVGKVGLRTGSTGGPYALRPLRD